MPTKQSSVPEGWEVISEESSSPQSDRRSSSSAQIDEQVTSEPPEGWEIIDEKPRPDSGALGAAALSALAGIGLRVAPGVAAALPLAVKTAGVVSRTVAPLALPTTLATEAYRVVRGKQNVLGAGKNVFLAAAGGEALGRTTGINKLLIDLANRSIMKATQASFAAQRARLAKSILPQAGSRPGVLTPLPKAPASIGASGAALGSALPLAFLGALERDANRDFSDVEGSNTPAGTIARALQTRAPQPRVSTDVAYSLDLNDPLIQELLKRTAPLLRR